MKDSRVYFVIFYPLLSFFVLFCQSFQLFSIGYLYPDLLLILTTIYAVSHGSFKGELYGFFMGFVFDLMSGALFGLNAFVFTLIGSCASFFQKSVKLPTLIVFIFYLIVVTIGKYILYHVFFVIFHKTSLFDFYFFIKIPSEILVNLVFGIALYILCARFDGRENYEWF